MTDYLLTNDPFDVGGTFSATAGRYDTDFADHSIFLNDNVAHGVKLPETDSIWISFDAYIGSLSVNMDGYMWRCFSQDNALLGYVNILNGAYTWVSVTGGVTQTIALGIPKDTVVRLDIHFVTNIAANPNDHQSTVYLNGAIAVQTSVNGGGGGAPSRFEFGGDDAFIEVDQGYWISNVRITDENPIGTKFKVLGPTGAGNYSDFIGGHVELGDFLATTVAYATANLDRVSATITPGVAPPGTLTKVALSATTRSSGPGADPSQIGLFARIGVTDYDGVLVTPAASILPLVETYLTNPATLSEWAWADLTGLEVGLRAAT
tara:strand:- start:2819 stop:3778 length:960 start_codon:yes stop_codon:yes gene_type:complete